MNFPAASPTPQRCMPLLAWPNVLSLDAVIVAAAWQQLLMRSFCRRSSTWPEIATLAATVWLIYVGDRLLDAARLNVSLPHTLRHRFYHSHRHLFLALWATVLVIDTVIAVRYLPSELLRCGLLLAAAVLIYGASVHLSPKRPVANTSEASPNRTSMRVPKELQVGILFAIGVSLTTLTQLTSDLTISPGDIVQIGRPMAMLAITTCGMAALFGCNCILVANFERDLDRAQFFSSIATAEYGFKRWYIGSVGTTARATAIVTMLPVALLVFRLPPTIWIALLTSAVGLCVSVILPNRLWTTTSTHSSVATFDARSVWVDAVLWTPPLVILCLT